MRATYLSRCSSLKGNRGPKDETRVVPQPPRIFFHTNGIGSGPLSRSTLQSPSRFSTTLGGSCRAARSHRSSYPFTSFSLEQRERVERVAPADAALREREQGRADQRVGEEEGADRVPEREEKDPPSQEAVADREGGYLRNRGPRIERGGRPRREESGGEGPRRECRYLHGVEGHLRYAVAERGEGVLLDAPKELFERGIPFHLDESVAQGQLLAQSELLHPVP